MGRELVRQLAADGCHVSMCDVSAENMAETEALAVAGAPVGHTGHLVRGRCVRRGAAASRSAITSPTRITPTTSTCCSTTPASSAGQLRARRSRRVGGHVRRLLGRRLRRHSRRSCPCCWPAPRATSSTPAASTASGPRSGPGIAHTAYSAAKFAVKGFTEALITDFRMNAPHLKASVVMPGHIGTSIVLNSFKFMGRDPKELTEEQIAQMRERLSHSGASIWREPATRTSATACRCRPRCSATPHR